MGALEEWVDEMVEAGDLHGELAKYRTAMEQVSPFMPR